MLRRIEDGALNENSVEELAQEFGVCARHMRRAISKEFGVTPIELAQTQRLLHAKQLLTETDLSVTDVAYAAGFESLRRFNSLFKLRYRLTPTALRRKSSDTTKLPSAADTGSTISFRIDYRPPCGLPQEHHHQNSNEKAENFKRRRPCRMGASLSRNETKKRNPEQSGNAKPKGKGSRI